MIAVLTIAAALAPFAADSAAEHPRELSALVRPTSLTVVNPTEEPRLLVFQPFEGGPSSTLWIAPHGEYQARFPQGTLDRMRLEVFLVGELGWRSSDAIHLGELQHDGEGLVDLLDLGSRLRFLSHSPRGPRFLEASGHLLPELRGLGGTLNNSAKGSGGAVRHVPVVPPRNRRHGNGPPRVGDKPLPPV